LLAAPVIVALAVAGSWRYMTGGQSTPLNVVIITLDTTRADRLSAYGYMDVSLPHLERLAAEGVVFDQATSVGALTLPAHASLFTGLRPPAHGIRENGDPPLADTHVTLAEVLKERGFRTAAFTGSVVLDAERGLAQGFDTYNDVSGEKSPDRHQRRADEVIGEATRWLEGVVGTPFLLWTHLYDPHRPYDPPPPYRSMHDPYMGEIAFADSQIGRLLDSLERRDLLERSIVIVVGDHGESMGDHGETDHGIFVYESVLRVPFILRAPALPPRRVGEVVRLTDVMPTVLDLLGIGGPSTDGVSLVDLMRGTRNGLGLEAYAESVYPRRFGWSPLYALRQGGYKFIEAPRPELYDLERDPFEQRNVHDQHPEVVGPLRDRLAALAHHDADGISGRGVPAELRRRLASLGYVGHSANGSAAKGEDLLDPKDCIAGYTSRGSSGSAQAAACADPRSAPDRR
jgi:arylsulfatase A-like enzyme